MLNVKRLRLTKNWTQRYLADELNITEATYGRYESGDINMKLEYILKISSIFNMSIDEIAEYDPDNQNKNFKYDHLNILKDKDHKIEMLTKQKEYLKKENGMLLDLVETKSRYLTMLENREAKE